MTNFNLLSTVSTDEFDIGASVFLAEASQAAYLDDYPEWAENNGFDNGMFFNEGNIQGFWSVNDDVGLLSFRGTSNIGQWIRDARITPVPHPWGTVHAGFKAGLNEVDEALQDFEQAINEAGASKRIWITGHSLGGALSVLAAARLKMQGINPSIYTFGQPRMGLADFRDRFNSELPDRLWRVINQSDIVARIPPGLIYRHCGNVKRIVRPGVLEAVGQQSIQLVMESNELPSLSDEEMEALELRLRDEPDLLASDLVRPEGLEDLIPSFAKDHFLEEYLKLLRELRDQ